MTGGFALIMDAKRPIIDAKPSSRTFGSRARGGGGKRAAGRSLATPYSRAEGAGTPELTGFYTAQRSKNPVQRFVIQPDHWNQKIGAFLFIPQIFPTQLPYIKTPYKALAMPNLRPGLKAQFVTKTVLSLRIFCPLFWLQSLIQLEQIKLIAKVYYPDSSKPLLQRLQ